MKQCNRHLIGFNDWPVMLLGIPLIGFFMPLLFFGITLDDGLLAYMPKFIVATAHTAIYWISLRALVLYFRRRFPEHSDTHRRLFWMFVTIVPTILLIALYALWGPMPGPPGGW